jgi:hypothetical protein
MRWRIASGIVMVRMSKAENSATRAGTKRVESREPVSSEVCRDDEEVLGCEGERRAGLGEKRWRQDSELFAR